MIAFARDRARPSGADRSLVLAIVLLGSALLYRATARPVAPVLAVIEVSGEVPRPGWYASAAPTVGSVLRAAGRPSNDPVAITTGSRIRVSGDHVEITNTSDPLLVGEPVDVNLADVAALVAVPGIGQRTAERIVEARSSRGPFFTVDELVEVRGISASRLEGSAVHLRADDPPKLSLAEATQSQLEALPGIGPVLARRILDARLERPFTSVGEMSRVSGVSPRRAAALAERVTR